MTGAEKSEEAETEESENKEDVSERLMKTSTWNKRLRKQTPLH